MTFIPHTYSAAEIVRAAATLAGRESDARDPEASLAYYRALNEFLQSVARSRPRWWLHRQAEWFATRSGQQRYRLRRAASATVAFSGGIALGDTVTIDGTAYAFTADTATASAAAAAFVALVNGTTDRPCAARQAGATVYLYWAGDDGDGKVVTDTVDAGSKIACTSFALHMQDFSRLLSPPQVSGYGAMRRSLPQDRYEVANETDGVPRGYCLDGALDGIHLYSSTYGAPDDVYLVRLGYLARPQAVLPDGQGSIDFPEEFHDILPHAVHLLVKAGKWDDAALAGDSWMQRRLAELERFGPDVTALPDMAGGYSSSEPADVFEVQGRIIG
jgi:hypothetical protein